MGGGRRSRVRIRCGPWDYCPGLRTRRPLEPLRGRRGECFNVWWGQKPVAVG